jgi:TfoX/Sxy family transcriptional regulator of competence genes
MLLPTAGYEGSAGFLRTIRMTQTSSEFVEHMLDLLGPLGEVSRGRFFGGYEIRLDAVQIGMVMGGKFYFRICQELRAELEIALSKDTKVT